MSYLNHAHDPRRRATAVVTVGAVHALLAAALVTGLTVQFVDHTSAPLKATNIPLDPPKPEPTPTRQPEPQHQAYVAPDPTPTIKLPTDTVLTRDPVVPDDVEFTYYPTGPIAPPAPSPQPGLTPKRPLPSNNSARWITNDDYPRRALVDEAEGSASYRLVIGTNGRVSSCDLTRSTGNRALDDATCQLISSRARFEPATDETGAKVLGTFTGSVRWDIPD